MAATWRLIFFKTFFLKFLRNLVYIYRFSGSASYWYCPFSCETENEAAATILVLSILINRSYFQLIALKPGIYRVTAWAEGNLSACTVFFPFEIIMNDLVNSFRFICIPMLWIYGHDKYFNSYSARIDFRRQILTSNVDSRGLKFELGWDSLSHSYKLIFISKLCY